MVLKYLIGNEAAIRAMAQQKNALWMGVVLVLTAGIAREYDQTYFLANPFKFFEPLVISFFSAGLLYLFVSLMNGPVTPKADANGLPPSPPPKWIDFQTFLSLFWMMAPLAWLYAIPVERFMTRADAARANIALLAIVATWRVLLLTRVVSVLSNTPYLRALCSVLLPSSGLLFLVSVGTGLSLIRVMGGLQHSPEDRVILDANAFAFFGSMVIGAASFIGAFVWSRGEPPSPLVPIASRTFPALTMMTMVAMWIAVAIVPQQELALHYRASELLRKQQHKELLDFLSRHSIADFPPSRRLPPYRFSYGIFTDLPKVISAMDGSEAPWVRECYLADLEFMMQQENYRWYSNYERDVMLQIVLAMERIPSGRAWAHDHKELFVPPNDAANPQSAGTPDKRVTEALVRLGLIEKTDEED